MSPSLLACLLLGLGSACSDLPARDDAARQLVSASTKGPSNDGSTAENPTETAQRLENSPIQEKLPLGPIGKSSQREHRSSEAWDFSANNSDNKKTTMIDVAQAEAKGLTIVDLSDDWTPFIFSHKTPGAEDRTLNRYAKRYIGLANDRMDSDGDRLPSGEHNYLELYGIPPSLSVIVGEWKRSDEVGQCLVDSEFDSSVFSQARDEGIRSIAFARGKESQRHKQLRAYAGRIRHALRKGKRSIDEDFSEAPDYGPTKKLYKRWKQKALEIEVIHQAQIRLRCERHFHGNEGKGWFKPGQFGGGTHHALAEFEKKHDLMGWGHFTASNMELLERSPDANVFQRLRRVIKARAISAAGILEDGSAANWKPKFRWKDQDGQEHALRNLSQEAEEATMKALGLDNPETARSQLARLEKLEPKGFETLLVAIKLPEKPAYYSEHMEFSTDIDRGDVWYDFPYDSEGNKKTQARRRFPKLTLYTHYNDQKIPIVRWRTTIGSWRSEEHEGREFLAYKNSDVGPRVWKDIVAAPVWIPPNSTPTRSLIKRKIRRGEFYNAINYDETGPSYKSAYGLVAAYHIKQVTRRSGKVVELDNQIRTHGSVDYMSILRRFSHGCHRLYNINAVRLFSFILKHHNFVRHGQVEVGYRRDFSYEGEDFHMELDTRGYRYELTPPVPVLVHEGRIRGSRRRPYTELMPKPGVDYEDSADSESGGDEPEDVENESDDSFLGF